MKERSFFRERAYPIRKRGEDMDEGKGCLRNWKMERNFGFAEEREKGELAREKREMGVYIVGVGRQVFGKGNL